MKMPKPYYGPGIMNNTIADSISQSGLADFLMPPTYLKLRLKYGGSLFTASLLFQEGLVPIMKPFQKSRLFLK